MTNDQKAILALTRENAALAARLKEHEQFRHQHRDCDAMGVENQSLRARLAEAESHLESLQNRFEQVTGENVTLAARLAAMQQSMDEVRPFTDKILASLAEAELSRDSWKREAEMNADFGDQLHIAMAALKQHGIHVAEKWCWCAPDVTDYRHDLEGPAPDSASVEGQK